MYQASVLPLTPVLSPNTTLYIASLEMDSEGREEGQRKILDKFKGKSININLKE